MSPTKALNLVLQLLISAAGSLGDGIGNMSKSASSRFDQDSCQCTSGAFQNSFLSLDQSNVMKQLYWVISTKYPSDVIGFCEPIKLPLVGQ